MKRLMGLGVVLIAAAFIASCGGGGGTTAGDVGDEVTVPTITTVSDLPGATSPMASSASESISKAVSLKAATTGLNFSSASASSFSSSSSMAACEMFNVLKESFQSAVEADTILCYIDQVNQQALFSGIEGIDIYDGEVHIFDLNFTGSEGGPPDKVKMQIVKNSAGNITSFEMFACADGSQKEYINLGIDGTSVTITAKGNYSDSEWLGSHQVGVSGTLNASGAYTQRAIAVANTGGNVGGTNTNHSEGTLTQTPGAFSFSGYQAGVYSEGGSSGSYAQSAYGVGEILNDTSASLSDLAMGDGAVKVDSAYTWSGGSYEPDPFIEAWLGDTAAAVSPATDSEFYDDADAGSTPTVADSVSISFSGDEVWDCSDEADASLPEMDMSVIEAACEALNHTWINCYNIIQPEGEVEEGSFNCDAFCSAEEIVLGEYVDLCTAACTSNSTCDDLCSAICEGDVNCEGGCAELCVGYE